jgi:hypothetical protein
MCGSCLKESSGDIKCDIEDGNCPGACTLGFYNEQCKLQCAKNCDNTKGCEKITGKCVACKIGFFGKKCENSCSKNCFNGGCDQHDGYCNEGCIPGWYNNTCESTCNKGCKHQICDRVTAECSHGCENGYKGKYCEMGESAVLINIFCRRKINIFINQFHLNLTGMFLLWSSLKIVQNI